MEETFLLSGVNMCKYRPCLNRHIFKVEFHRERMLTIQHIHMGSKRRFHLSIILGKALNYCPSLPSSSFVRKKRKLQGFKRPDDQKKNKAIEISA